LSQFDMPSFLGQPAMQVGEPAGGSLSADTYKGLSTVFLPIIIPLVWDECLTKAQKEYDVAMASFMQRMKEWERKHGARYRARQFDDHPGQSATRKSHKIVEPPKKPSPRMLPGEDQIFLKLATATKIYTQYELTDAEVYGIKKMKPNHHYVVHLPAQIYDYGPVYGFWCFLGERLNKLLKSFKSNIWGGGQLEVSMVREWGRNVQLQETVSCA
ncbi:hypothetical protein JB92DRAFT_2764526, partial [Gautieria morchelliformis]